MADSFGDATWVFGRFTLQPRRKLLLEADQPVRLGSRALELLLALVERPGDVLSRDELVARLWPHTVVEDTSLRVHASRLRKALRDGENGARYIVNVPGRGYVFVAPVARVPADVSDAVAAVRTGPASSLSALLQLSELSELVELLVAALGHAGQPAQLAAALLARLRHPPPMHAQRVG